MSRNSELQPRQEMNENVERNTEDMHEKEGDLEKTASDIEKIRELIERLDLRGSAEGADQVERSVESAEDVTESVFDEQDGDLEGRQEHSDVYKGEIEGKAEATEGDLGKLSDAGAALETQEAVKEFVGAKAGALEDIDTLKKLVDQAQEAREKSDEIQDKHRRTRAGS